MPGARGSVPETPDGAVPAIRHFNRFYTRQIGVLQEGLLQSSLSLTEVRVLYELAHRSGVTATALAREMDLDPGYLSRILREFSRRGWLQRQISASDRRQTWLALTARGSAALRPLEQRSDRQVRRMLAPISPEDRRALLHVYADEYRYDQRFEALVAEIASHFIRHLDAARDRCWIAERGAERVGSVMVVHQSRAVAKLRLLLVEPSARGLGIGKRLVQECIRFARHAGYRKIVLWTQSELTAARAIYRHAGFRLVKQEAHQNWGRHDLVAETWDYELSRG
jgi:DNA-binding MarR family transcriptional regulator/N-acetylglutamate synthase-like GNAT family acetyltransferase